MTKRMLIDSTNAEETRVVVLDGNRLDEFDVETSTKHQLKGNIYLAKVVRVEPSLQAAFVEYGGNRHGFLAFGEIHPDYYQIPVADRKRLLEAQEQEAREDEEAEERAVAAQDRGTQPAGAVSPRGSDEAGTDDEPLVAEAPSAEETSAASNDHPAELDAAAPELASADDTGIDPVPETERVDVAQPAAIAPDMVIAPEEASTLFADEPGQDLEPKTEAGESSEQAADDEEPPPEQLGGENDTEESDRRSTPRFLRHYKIQEVIRRRQILLIQVVKEERGSKGAALTTYISLAGRFSVLMPNSPRGGGISRKITSAADRRRLKEVTSELDLPRGMGLIVRTAGANRPKPEILRDCEYLLNQWDQIRELTMKSMAPALIYEEASLIKRAIRDVYSRDVDDILVDGEQGWRAARDFMRMLMPTHARKVQLWKEPTPLFAKAQVEQQLEGMLQPTVQLRSGGYLVINQTEALVAIDVNSGRSTRERGIEETALRTNLEAAEEAARQLRLRDLAGLIVIDFIDMESRRNVASVERRLKDALKSDRARIQVGGISHFGLLEMSRQRLRPSLMETNFVTCPHCGGSGHMRSTESAALVTLRAIEEEGGRRRAAEIMVYCASSIALYILNHKRQRLTEIEARHSMLVTFVADESLLPPQLRIEKVRAQTASDLPSPIQQLAPPEPFEDPDELEAEAESGTDAELEADDEDEDEAEPTAAETSSGPAGESGEKRPRRRRRRRGGRREEGGANGASAGPDNAGEMGEDEQGDVASVSAEAEPSGVAPGEAGDSGEQIASGDAEEGERRRRGRRGGRRRRRDGSEGEVAGTPPELTEEDSFVDAPVPSYAGPTPANPFGGTSAFDIFDAIEQAEEQRLTQPKPALAAEPVSPPQAAEETPEPAAPAPEPEPVLEAAAVEPVAVPAEPEPAEPEPVEPVAPPPEPVVAGPVIQPVLIGAETEPTTKKRGWWRR